MKFKLLILLLFLLSSCNTSNSPTFGPVSQADFQQRFLEDIRDEQQQILFYSRAIWYPE